MPSLGGCSPYRVVLGMEPRTPPTFASEPLGKKRISANDYVENMVDVFQITFGYVRNFKKEQRDAREFDQVRSAPPEFYDNGDCVLVLRPELMADIQRPGAISKKVLHRVYDTIYHIRHRMGDVS